MPFFSTRPSPNHICKFLFSISLFFSNVARLNRVYVEDIYDGRSVAGLPSTGKLQYSYGSFNYGSQGQCQAIS